MLQFAAVFQSPPLGPAQWTASGCGTTGASTVKVNVVTVRRGPPAPYTVAVMVNVSGELEKCDNVRPE